MKTLRISLTALMLVIGLALLGGPTPVQADGPTTFTFAGGSLTTANLDAWGGGNRLEYHANFDFSAGPTTITVHGIDLTEIWYEGRWPWPPLAESQGAQARFGITANGFWSRHQIHSAIGNGGGSWDQQGATWNHDDGFRKYLIQNQWSGTTSDVTVGNHQYNVEAYIPRTGAGPSVNDPALVTDRAYNTFDMRITYAPTGIPGEYQVQGWVRLHKAASTDEMAIRPGIPPWGSPYTWVWNVAMNNQANPEDAWVPFFDGSWVITGDYISARPYVEIMNWGVPQTRSHTFSWDSLVVEGTPAPVSEVCVDDGFAGSSPGDPLDGSACGMGAVTFGYDAFATIQEGINMVSGSTVYVAAGTYTEAATVPPGADLTIQGAGRDATTWIAPADDASRMHCIQCDLQGYTGSTTLDISGFTFSVEDNEIDNGGIAILVNKARQGPLNLAIHDNKFVETTTIPGETANSMLLCHDRFAARGTDAPVKIYNNLDETAGGIAMSNSRAFDVYNNTFDSGSDALYIGYGCPTNTTVGDHHIYNNTFKNASNVYPDGPWPSILFSYYGSGTGMTFLPSTIEHNFFEDNDVAVGYGMDSDITYPADVIRDNSFEGSNEYAVQVWGAYSTTVDASGNWWGTNAPAGVAAQVSANVDYTPWLDSGTDTSTDSGFQGDFSALHVDDDSPQTESAGRIQEGVDMVSGSTVYVAAGTYQEQVEIITDLTLVGAGSGTVVQSPDVLTKYYTTSGDNYPVIYVHDTDDVTIQDLVVDGAGKGNANYRFVGIGYHNAGGTVDSVDITDVRDTPWSGAQHGVAMYAFNEDGTARTLTVSDCNIHDFQKNGMALLGDNLTVDVYGNTVTGYGPTNVTAQNGIQVGYGATGIVGPNNNVSDVSWLGPTWTASGILILYGDVDITDNTVSNGQTGIYVWEGSSNISGNDISASVDGTGTDSYWGIIAADPPGALPRPFDGSSEVEAQSLSVTSLGTTSLAATSTRATVNVEHNTLTGGDDSENSEGLEADAGYGTDNLAFTATCNDITGWGYGVVIYQCQADCTGTTFDSIQVHDNNIFNNIVGMYANVASNATYNWWGDASGPSHVTNPDGKGDPVTDNVDFKPWLESEATCTPTAITLASFTAEAGVGSVALAWETGTEVDNAGFNLYRATAEGGPYTKVNGALIAAEGDPVSGTSYTFLDKGLSPGTYYYKLEDVDLTGTTTLHGPVSAAVLPRLRRPTYRPTLP